MSSHRSTSVEEISRHVTADQQSPLTSLDPSDDDSNDDDITSVIAAVRSQHKTQSEPHHRSDPGRETPQRAKRAQERNAIEGPAIRRAMLLEATQPGGLRPTASTPAVSQEQGESPPEVIYTAGALVPANKLNPTAQSHPGPKRTLKNKRAGTAQQLGTGPQQPITIDDSDGSSSANPSAFLRPPNSMGPPPSLNTNIKKAYLRCSLRLDMVHEGPNKEIRDMLDELLHAMGNYGRRLLDTSPSVYLRNSVLHICRDVNCEFLHQKL